MTMPCACELHLMEPSHAGANKKQSVSMDPAMEKELLEKQRATHQQKLKYEQQLHELRKSWAAENAELLAAKTRAEQQKRQNIAAAKALRTARQQRIAEKRKEQLAALESREQVIKVCHLPGLACP